MLTESSEENMKTNIIGKPIDRVDARLKVTGAAKYAAEFSQNNLAYAFPVRSTIGKGAIATIDTGAAEKSAGVLAVMTHKNAPRLKPANIMEVGLYGTLPGESLLPLQDGKIFYVGQYIGLVVAETYEQARAAAGLVKVNYREVKPATGLAENKAKGKKPEKMFRKSRSKNSPMRWKFGASLTRLTTRLTGKIGSKREHFLPLKCRLILLLWQAANRHR
jgi:xanthine dehydrogenase YagR molybdenum-binding subunit